MHTAHNFVEQFILVMKKNGSDGGIAAVVAVVAIGGQMAREKQIACPQKWKKGGEFLRALIVCGNNAQ